MYNAGQRQRQHPNVGAGGTAAVNHGFKVAGRKGVQHQLGLVNRLAVQIAHLRKNNVLAAPRLCRNRQHLRMGGVKPVPLRPAPPAGGQNVALHRFAGLYQLCHNAGNGGKAEAGCTGKGTNAGAVRRVQCPAHRVDMVLF